MKITIKKSIKISLEVWMLIGVCILIVFISKLILTRLNLDTNIVDHIYKYLISFIKLDMGVYLLLNLFEIVPLFEQKKPK